jgi:hypothetical protein
MAIRKNSPVNPPSEETVKTNPTSGNSHDSEVITRKEAFARAGRYAAFTAATMMMVLTPKESPASSGAPANQPDSPATPQSWP